MCLAKASSGHKFMGASNLQAKVDDVVSCSEDMRLVDITTIGVPRVPSHQWKFPNSIRVVLLCSDSIEEERYCYNELLQ